MGDSIPNKPQPVKKPDPPKSIKEETPEVCPVDAPITSDSESSSHTKSSTKKHKKSSAQHTNDSLSDNTDGGGGVTAIYSADKTTHVIEYGIQHDAIRASRANTKAIKDKIRKKREEEKKKEQEALKKHKEAMDRLKNLKSTTSKTNIDSNDTLEFGMSDAVKQKRAEIKAIKEKRRKSKLHSSVSSSPSLKPSKLSKEKSLEKK